MMEISIILENNDCIDMVNSCLKKKPEVIAIDTEFIRQNTFFPELCLIQLSFDDRIYLIDTINDERNIKALQPLLDQQKIIKVFHSGRQDCEIFVHELNTFPSPFFDTQTAAIFLGFGDNVGYNTLIKHYLGVDVDKSQQHTDWKKRPLSPKQITYAANDVIYLKEFYPKIIDDLQRQERFEWAREEMEFIKTSFSLTTEPTTGRLIRLKISRKDAFMAKHIFNWREEHAQRLNINRSSLLNETAIHTLTKIKNKESLESYAERCLSHLNHYDLFNDLIDFIEHVRGFHHQFHEQPLTPPQQKELQNLKKEITVIAQRHNLPLHFFASHDDVLDFVKEQKGKLTTKWRQDLLNAANLKECTQ